MPEWSYVFCDAVTDAELATLPVSDVTFEKVLNGTGKLEGFIPTVDPKVRVLDPWAATEPRRCVVYVYLGEELIWGGMIWQRVRSHDGAGLRITAATFDSWLATQILTADVNVTERTAAQIMATALAGVQAAPGANLGFQVVGIYGENATGSVATAEKRTLLWRRTDTADFLTRMGSFLTAAEPVEWRIDLEPRADGRVAKKLLIGEPRLGSTTEVTGLYLWYSATQPGSTLMSFTDLDDGAVQSNAAAGSIPDPDATADTALFQRLWSYHESAEIGNDEIAAGFPRVMRGLATMDRNIRNQAQLDTAVLATVADGMSQGKTMSNFSVAAHGPDLVSYEPGDNVDVDITHPAYREFPKPTSMKLRILGRRITPRSPGVPDKVELSVFDADSARLPRSTTLVAHMRDLIRRVKALEVM